MTPQKNHKINFILRRYTQPKRDSILNTYSLHSTLK